MPKLIKKKVTKKAPDRVRTERPSPVTPKNIRYVYSFGADAGKSSVQELPPRVQELIAKCLARPDLQPELKAMLGAYFAALFEEQP